MRHFAARIALLVLALLIWGSPALAAPVLPPGWVLAPPKAGPASQIYSHGDDGSLTVMDVPMSLYLDHRKLLQKFDTDLCVGLSAAPAQPIDGGVVYFVAGKTAFVCALFVMAGNGQPYMMFGMENTAAKLNIARVARIIIDDKQGNSAAAMSSPVQGTSLPSSQATEATLRAALASVPAASRPIAIVTRNEPEMSGGFVYYKYKPWMLFANGWATDSRCYDWDPRSTVPMPGQVQSFGKPCDAEKWRKTAAGYEFQDKDGKWDGDGNGAKLYGFAPGQRLEVALERLGGTSTAPMAGMTQVVTIMSGKLRMTQSGYIQSDWVNQLGISGGGLAGGGSSRDTDLAGQYYADGFLIAVGGANGAIRVGFIGGSHDSGDARYKYIYLNGDMYWPGDKN